MFPDGVLGRFPADVVFKEQCFYQGAQVLSRPLPSARFFSGNSQEIRD